MVLSDAEELEPAAKGSRLADEILLLHAKIFTEKYAAGEAGQTLAMILERDAWDPRALAELSAVHLKQLQLKSVHHITR